MNRSPLDGQDTLVFSESAARRDALAETLQHPLTLWPAVVGISGAVAAGLFALVSFPVAGSIALGGVGFGITNWAIRFFGGKDNCMKSYYNRLHEQFEILKEKKLATLGKDLKKLGCKLGCEQVSQFEEKFQNLLIVLERVLSSTELTFGRYKVTAEQVYHSGIENLDRVITILTNIDDIDRQELSERIDALEKNQSGKSSEEITLKALRERLRLYDQSQEEVANLLAQNEQALTAIDAAGVAAGNIRGTKSTASSGNLASAMEELVILIERARGPKQTSSISI
ncbi:MAG: hypothetical protein WC229_02240 [Candidatus Paceibacterota bacterium]|jgi:hypothetical protein